MTPLTADQALANWDLIGGFLADGARYALGRVHPDQIATAVAEGMGMIVIAWDPTKSEVYAAFFCEIERYDTGRTCWNVSLCGGRELDQWAHLWPVLKQIGRDQGCDQVEISGRPGWGRVLGLKPAAHLFVEDL